MAAVRPFHHLAPPLQADQRQAWFAGSFVGAGKFMIERVQCKKHRAQSRGREQCREIPVRVVPPNQWPEVAHAAAARPARNLTLPPRFHS